MGRRIPRTPPPKTGHRILVARTAREGVVVSVWKDPADGGAQGPPIATIRGRPYRLLEPLLLKRLAGLGLPASNLKVGKVAAAPAPERDAVALALLFRALAPMRSIDRIRLVAEGIDRLSPEEANYWLGMALHRQRPRRVLAALRMLLTTP